MHRSIVTFFVVLLCNTATSTPCTTDANCPYTGPFRCCGANARAENCPSDSFFFDDEGNVHTSNTNCVLPGTTGATNCECKPSECIKPKYLPAVLVKAYITTLFRHLLCSIRARAHCRRIVQVETESAASEHRAFIHFMLIRNCNL